MFCLDDRIFQFCSILMAKAVSEYRTDRGLSREHRFALYIDEFEDWEDYDTNGKACADGVEDKRINVEDEVLLMHRLRARGRWNRLRRWVTSRGIAFYWYERTAHLMEENGRL